MRVITGSARGMRLKTLDGYDTRPTSDRIKESVFNIIQFDVEGRRAADLFAGSGQLGIEALSRGAREAVFVDIAADAIKIIRSNLEHTKFTDRSRVLHMDVKAFLAGAKEKFDLIFLDPPYSAKLLKISLESIAAFDILSEGGIIVCEGASDAELPALAEPYHKGREYIYGRTKITLFGKS